MIRSPAGYSGDVRIKRYLDYYQPSYGAMVLAEGLFGSGTPAGNLLGSEPSGLAIDFISSPASLLNRYISGSGGVNYSGAIFQADGGPVAFTRASSATYTNSSGLVATAAINEYRLDYDPVTLAPNGLLVEEQRTNLCLRSSALTTAPWFLSNATGTPNTTDVLDPAGTNTATKFVTATSPGLGQGFLSTATAHTGSIWLRTNSGTAACSLFIYRNSPFALVGSKSITVTSTWQRFEVTGTLLDTTQHNFQINLANNSTVYGWGAQFEVGAFATSYIPTVASSVTRSADGVSIPTSAFPYSSTAGTLIARGIPMAGSIVNANNIAVLNASTTSDSLAISRYIGNGACVVSVYNASALQAWVDSGTWSDGVDGKVAATYAANDFAASYNGGTVVTDTAGAVPSGINTLYLGSSFGVYGRWNGWIKQITYIPRRLTDAELQARTA